MWRAFTYVKSDKIDTGPPFFLLPICYLVPYASIFSYLYKTAFHINDISIRNKVKYVEQRR